MGLRVAYKRQPCAMGFVFMLRSVGFVPMLSLLHSFCFIMIASCETLFTSLFVVNKISSLIQSMNQNVFFTFVEFKPSLPDGDRFF
jgi:hypothetical protein